MAFGGGKWSNLDAQTCFGKLGTCSVPWGHFRDSIGASSGKDDPDLFLGLRWGLSRGLAQAGNWVSGPREGGLGHLNMFRNALELLCPMGSFSGLDRGIFVER